LGRLRDWLPPEVIRLGLNWSGHGVYFKGQYVSWEEASRHAQGYDADAIAKRVLQATLAVREGRAAFERDGVLFAEPDYPYPLLAALMRGAALATGRLDVLDFGGALGSTYFQCRPWLYGLPSLHWRVVEQPHFVTLGRDRVADGTVEFVERIEDCAAGGAPNVAVISGVLQYVPNPADIIDRIAALKPSLMIIDRTPVIAGGQDVISVQVVPERIVRSSYPIRLFAQHSLTGLVGREYRLVSEFRAVDGVLGGLSRRVEFKGFIFERRT